MLQHDEPDDFVIASGESHTVREFVELAFERAGIDWRRHVEVDPRYFRPAEVSSLWGIRPGRGRRSAGRRGRASTISSHSWSTATSAYWKTSSPDASCAWIGTTDRSSAGGAEPLDGAPETLLDVDLGLVANQAPRERHVGLRPTDVACLAAVSIGSGVAPVSPAMISSTRLTDVGACPPPMFMTCPYVSSVARPARRLASTTSSMYWQQLVSVTWRTRRKALPEARSDTPPASLTQLRVCASTGSRRSAGADGHVL